MQIIIADACGFCYGVKRAVEVTEKAAEGKAAPIGTLGPLIHNPQIIADLKEKGVSCLKTLNDFPAGSTVIIRSHGVGPDIYRQATERCLKIVDATCPNVLNAQKQVCTLAEQGYLPVIIGEHRHPEVQSILAWAGQNGLVVENEADIANVHYAEKYGVVVQTTFEIDRFEELLAILQKERPGHYEIRKTICRATAERQQAAVKLAKQADAIIVIGGYNSANTRHLYDIVSKTCNKCYHVETPSEISSEMLRGCEIIGITAGASTPDWLIKEAVLKMENLETMENLLEKETIHLHIGMTVEATVVAVTKEEVIVDFGYQSEGRIPFAQWGHDADKESVLKEVQIGDKVTAKVVASENQDGLVELSKLKAEAEKAWELLKQEITEKKALEVTGLSAVKGGLTVKTEGLVGFIPASHLSLRRVDDIDAFVGQQFQAEIIEVDPAKKRLVLSRRNLLKAEKEEADKLYWEERTARAQGEKEARLAAQQATFESLQEGSTAKGVVRKIVDFGLFVELGTGVQGLVHISEASWEKGKKLEELFQVGDEIDVFVKKIDNEQKRISLSVKMLTEDPWVKAVSELQEGDVTEGKVEKFLPFGALVKIAPNLEGLVHVSEIAETRVAKPEDVLTLGQTVRVKVLKIEKKSKKLSLSINKASQEEAKAEYAAFLNDKPELSVDLAEKLTVTKSE